MNEVEVVAAAKMSGVAGMGSVIALRFLPGSAWQKAVSFVASMGLGCLGGGAAMEFFSLTPGGYLHMMAVASSAVFGLAIIHNAMQQLPLVMSSLRKRFLGGD